MAAIQPPPNSVWPNGLQTDSEGYVNFYPLGTNKVDISTITWPEGTKVKSPFVYQDDKLVGFVDTKALEIDNNDTTIDINYTHFDADLDSIMENTLTINAPENATVNVKYGAVDKVLTEKIEKVLGKGNCKVNFYKDMNKAIVAVALDTTESQIADVQSLLERVLPSNLVTEMEWIDGLPMSYTRLEYLESTRTQYLKTNYYPKSTDSISCQALFLDDNSYTFRSYGGFGNNAIMARSMPSDNEPVILVYNGRIKLQEQYTDKKCDIHITSNSCSLNNKTVTGETSFYHSPTEIKLFSSYDLSTLGKLRMFCFAAKDKDALKVNFIPALDPTGAPCMFDTVTKTAFYNAGSGDFMYPGAEQAVQTTDLDAKSYAKLTEHGVRRLYHVPEGCAMTKDEYAAANGFKELVEPPMPLEGYWVSEWRETEMQLICDWVETEPPTEEVETFNNEN